MNLNKKPDRFDDTSEHEDVLPSTRESRSNRFWSSFTYGRFLFALSILLNVLLILFPSHIRNEREQSSPVRHARTNTLNTVWRRFYWHTRWDKGDRNETDRLWDTILPSHGIVAVDREQAAKNGWPESMFLPSDHSKGVYLLEAYHQLHCLKILRQTFHEAVERRPYTYDPHHAEHCFDALRQSTVCNADNTPLYTFGDKTAGDGQVHKCRDWGQLRDWATENTACFRDSVHDIPLGEHFGYCDDGDDGIDASEFQIDV